MQAWSLLARADRARGRRSLWPVVAWRTALWGIRVTVRLEAVVCFLLMAVALGLLIMPWALDSHPTMHVLSAGHARHSARVTVHASWPLVLASTLALIAIIAAATIGHELGHALALQKAGAAGTEIVIFGAGGICRAQARDTTPLALLWYAAAGPLVSIGTVLVLIVLRMIFPWPHPVRVILWLSSAIMVGTLALNLIPVLARSDGGHMLRNLAVLLGEGRWTRRAVSAALTLPVLTLIGTLQSDQVGALLSGALTVLVTVLIARIAWSADRKRAPLDMPRPSGVGRAISFW